MICSNDRSREFGRELSSLCRSSPMGARIESYYLAYSGGNYSFLDTWLCYDDEKAYCAISRYYDTVVLCGKSSHEVNEFLRMLSPQTLMCDSQSGVNVPFMDIKKGETMQLIHAPKVNFDNISYTEVLSGDMRSLKEVYELLMSEYGDTPPIGRFEDYFVDTSHMIRHGDGEVRAIRENGKIIAALSVTAKSPSAAVLGNIVTHRDHRRRGYATALILRAASELYESGRKVYLYREKSIKLYERLGFAVVGEWETLRSKNNE